MAIVRKTEFPKPDSDQNLPKRRDFEVQESTGELVDANAENQLRVPVPLIINEELVGEDEGAIEEAIAEARRTLELESPETTRGDLLDFLMRIAEPAGDEDPLRKVARQKELVDILGTLPESRRHQLEGVYQRIEQVKELREQIRIAKLIEERVVDVEAGMIDKTSGWTHAHSDRVAQWTYLLMRGTGNYRKDYMSSVFLAMLLHDIGKVRIPKDILDKPGSLTDEEYKIIKSHALQSSKILSENYEHINPVMAQSALHHEQKSGKGYPFGLKGAEIPPISQYGAAADVWDALVGDRVYMRGRTSRKAMGIMHEMAEFGHFEPIVFARLKSMYINGELDPDRYFASDALHAEIVQEIAENDDFAEDKNNELRAAHESKLANLLGAKQGDKPVALFNLSWHMKQLPDAALQELIHGLDAEVDVLTSKREEMRTIVIDSLFLMSASMEARTLVYVDRDAEEAGNLGRKKALNWARYALLIAQQAGMSLEDQRRVNIAAIFATVGMMSADEEKAGRRGVLSITDYDSIMKAPQAGLEIISPIATDPVIGKEFDGALEATKIYRWFNGRGYGLREDGTEVATDISQIALISLDLVARLSPSPYREKGMEPEDAISEMRSLVGTKYDPKIFKYVEQLFALSYLSVYTDRPETVEKSKKILAGERADIMKSGPMAEEVCEWSDKIFEAKDPAVKLELCLQAAERMHALGRGVQVDRFLSLAEELIVQTGDRALIERIKSLYAYNLESALQLQREMVNEHLQAAREYLDQEEPDVIAAADVVRRIIGSIDSLLRDYAETGNSLPGKEVAKLRAKIYPIYKEIGRKALELYRDRMFNGDGAAALSIEQLLDRIMREIGDEELSKEAKLSMEQAKQDLLVEQIDDYLGKVGEDIASGASQDPSHSEFYVATARRLANDLALSEEAKIQIDQRINRIEKELFAAGYKPLFDHLVGLSDQGEVELTDLYIEKVRAWMTAAEGVAVQIPDEVFEQLARTARLRGIDTQVRYLYRQDLGLKHVDLVERWTENVRQWQEDLGEAVVDNSHLSSMAYNANEVIKRQLPDEAARVMESGSEADLKRFMILMNEYVRDDKHPQLYDESVDVLYQRVGDRLFEEFVKNLHPLVEKGNDVLVDKEIGYFHSFCREEEKERGKLPRLVTRYVLNQEHEDVFARLRIDASAIALDRRAERILDEGAIMPTPRIFEEIKDLRAIWNKLDASVESANYEHYATNLNQAIEAAFAGKFSEAINRSDMIQLADDLIELRKLVAQEESLDIEGPLRVQFDKARLSNIYQSVEAYVEELLASLTQQGDKVRFDATLEALSIYDDHHLEESVLDNLQETAMQRQIEVATMRIELYGLKSKIDKVHKAEDLLVGLGGQESSLGMSDVYSIARSQTERIARSYELYAQMLGHFGSLMITTRVREIDNFLPELIANLGATNSGREDAARLEALLAVKSS